MKILHTADWHLGAAFFGNDRSAEHRAFSDFLLAALREESPDALVVAGDVFDTPNPPAEAQRAYYGFLHRAVSENPGIQIVVIAGNHDSAGRIEAPEELLAAGGVFVRGRMCGGEEGFRRAMIPLRGREDPEDLAVCLAVPFLRSYELPEGKSCADSMSRLFRGLAAAARRRYGSRTPLVLLAHFYAAGSETADGDPSERAVIGGEERVDVSPFGAKFDYAALGHIHKAQAAGGMENVRYAGAPLPMSFGEKGYSRGIVCVETGVGRRAEIRTIPFTPPRALVSIPAKGALSVGEALEAVGRLPRASEGGEADYPYVEVRVNAAEADPSVPARIRAAFEGKAAVLCSVKRVEKSAAGGGGLDIRTMEQLRSLSPQSVAQTVYGKRYGGEEMPARLLALLRQAEQSAQALSEEQ